MPRYIGVLSKPRHVRSGIFGLIKPSETAKRRPDLQLSPQLLNQLLFITQITDTAHMSGPQARRQWNWTLCHIQDGGACMCDVQDMALRV